MINAFSVGDVMLGDRMMGVWTEMAMFQQWRVDCVNRLKRRERPTSAEERALPRDSLARTVFHLAINVLQPQIPLAAPTDCLQPLVSEKSIDEFRHRLPYSFTGIYSSDASHPFDRRRIQCHCRAAATSDY